MAQLPRPWRWRWEPWRRWSSSRMRRAQRAVHGKSLVFFSERFWVFDEEISTPSGKRLGKKTSGKHHHFEWEHSRIRSMAVLKRYVRSRGRIFMQFPARFDWETNQLYVDHFGSMCEVTRDFWGGKSSNELSWDWFSGTGIHMFSFECWACNDKPPTIGISLGPLPPFLCVAVRPSKKDPRCSTTSCGCRRISRKSTEDSYPGEIEFGCTIR